MTEPVDTSHAGHVVAAPEAPCDAAVVKRRAKAGIATILVAVFVAVVTLAAAGATLLVTGLVPLSGLEGQIASAIRERLGPDWEVEAQSAELGRIDGRSQLRVRQVSFRHSSGAVVRAPEAVLGYEPLALLLGNIKLVSVDLRGVNVRLGVDHAGALVLSADAAPLDAPVTPFVPDSAQWDAFTGIMGAVATLAKGNGLLGSLETAGMQGARLSFVDPSGRQRAGLDDVDIRLSRLGERSSRLTMKGRTGPRWKEFVLDLTSAADGTQKADLEIVRFEPAEVVALALGAGNVVLDALSITGQVSLTQQADGKRAVSARLDVAPGKVSLPESPIAPLIIDSAHLDIASGETLNDLTIKSAAIKMGATQLAAAGSLREENGGWRMAIAGKGAIAGRDTDAPVVIDALAGKIFVSSSTGEVTIDDASLLGPAISASISGTVLRAGDAAKQKLLITATGSQIRALLAVWPRWTSPELHVALTQQLKAGLVSKGEIKLDLSAEDHARVMRGGPMTDANLQLTFEAGQIAIQADPGLPPIVGAVASGTATGKTTQIAIPSGTADLGNGRTLAISEGNLTVADTTLPRAPAKVAFRAVGPVDAVAALLTFPALKGFSSGAVDPAAFRGMADMRTNLVVPLAPDVQPGEVVVQSSGTLSGVASDTLLAPEKLDAGTFAVNFDRAGLSLRGEARVGGEKAAIEVRQNPKGVGEASLATTLDNAARQKRGFGPETGLTGPVQVKIVKALGKASDAAPRVDIDLTKAAIDGPVPWLVKAAGKPGRVSFAYVADADGPDLDDFLLDASPTLLRGKVELSRQNTLEAASFTQVRISPGDNLKVDIKRDGSLTKVSVRGPVGDARPFIRDIQGGAPPAAPARGEKPSGRGGDIDIDLDVPILTGFNNEAISNAVLKLSRRSGEIKTLNFQGRIGKADITAKQARPGDGAGLLVQSENGGALLRYLDLYRRAYGGDLILSMSPRDTRQSGDLLFRNFVVRDEPALRRVVGEQPAAAGAGSSTTASGGTARFDPGAVAFTKLKAEFVRSAGRLDVTDMVIWGQQVGFTLQGNVDYDRDRVDIGGTFVPGYALNNAFAQIPVVGALLGGGSQYGGLFAVNFRISGAASAPTMTINPLSAIAPGILRRFVDPLGGGPLERPNQPVSPSTPER